MIMREMLEDLTENGMDILAVQQESRVPLKVLLHPEEARSSDIAKVMRVYERVIGDIDERE